MEEISKNKNIILFGSYSGNNKGDLAILKAIILNLNENKDISNIFIPSKNPKRMSSYFNDEKVIFFQSMTSYLGKNLIHYLKQSDLILIGGGGIIFSAKLFNPFFNHLINIFFIILLNKLFFKKPVYFIAIGISHLNGWFSRFLASFILNSTSEITVRDELSLKTAKQLSNQEIKLFRDPAFTLKKMETKNVKKILKTHISTNKKNIIFCINNAILNWFGEDELINFINKLSNKNNIVLFENNHSSHRSSKFFIEHDFLQPEEVIKIISHFDLAISAPMHFSIFSFLAKTPTLLISYNDKVKEFAKFTENENILTIQELNSINLENNIDKLLAQKKSKVKILEIIINSANDGFTNLLEFVKRI